MRPVTTRTRRPAARARAIAAFGRGRNSPSSQISVRSRSQARTSTSRGRSGGRSAARDDVGGHVGDLLLAQRAAEGRHAAAAVRDLRDRCREVDVDSSRFGPTLPDVPASASVTAPTALRREDLLAPRRRLGPRRRPAPPVSVGTVPITVSGVGVASSLPPHAGRRTSTEGEDEREDAGHGARSIPAARRRIPSSRRAGRRSASR